jgi:hypothetical protein
MLTRKHVSVTWAVLVEDKGHAVLPKQANVARMVCQYLGTLPTTREKSHIP